MLRSASRTFTLSATRILFPVAVLLNDSCMRKQTSTSALQQVRQGDGALWGASRIISLWQAKDCCPHLYSNQVTAICASLYAFCRTRRNGVRGIGTINI